MHTPIRFLLLQSLIIGLTLVMPRAKAWAQAERLPGAPQMIIPEPSALISLRKQFRDRALSSTRVMADQYYKALAALETQAVESGDYETALAAQQRQQQLAANYANVASDSSEAVILKPADAKTAGTVTYDRNERVLSGWRVVGTTASWDIFKVNPGNYTVTMTYSAYYPPVYEYGIKQFRTPPEDVTGGVLEFFEVTGLGGGDTNKLTTSLHATGAWATYLPLNLGEIKLTRTSARLTLKIAHLANTFGLMHLKEIRLTPAKPTVVKIDYATTQEYTKEHRAHVERLAELGQPIADIYLARLKSISDSLAFNKDDEGVQAVLAESRRVKHTVEMLGKEKRPEPGTSFTRLDGLEEIQDARYVPDPANTGDSFMISTKNQSLLIHLMSVSCPSPRPEDMKSHDYHSSYFGISTDDSVALGQQAREFTDAYLKEKPLRIFTRWTRNKNGEVLAQVVPGDIGEFSGILVDNGLAAINVPQAGNSEKKRIEEAITAPLKERETAAKASPLPPGGWSFVPLKSNP
ncbi:MAG: hypothetical protein WCN98_14655 [Verrucomicrobiaceae bacterium]